MLSYINNRIFELSNPYNDYSNLKIYYTYRVTKFLNFIFSNKKINKYFFLDLFIEIYFLISNFIFFPLALILKVFNFKVYVIDNKSFGDYLHELSILKNSKNIIIIPTNNFYKFEIYQNILFDKIVSVNNFFISHFFLILNTYHFLRADIFKNKYLIEPKHYSKNKNLFAIKNNLREFLIRQKIKKNKIKVDNRKYSLINNFKEHCKKNKIAIINPRIVFDRRNKLRNSQINNYKKTISFLLSKNYKIFLFDKNLKLKNNKIKYIDFKSDKNKVLQICAFENCNLYIGSYSGMGHFTDLFKTPSIYVDEIFLSGYYFNDNCLFLPKKRISGKEYIPFTANNFLRLSSLFIDDDLKRNKVKFINNSSEEILSSVKDFVSNKKFKTISIDRKFGKYLIFNKIAFTFFKKNKKLFKKNI
jgi:putative glycosyltransferase (TIGR04372 family)